VTAASVKEGRNENRFVCWCRALGRSRAGPADGPGDARGYGARCPRTYRQLEVGVQLLLAVCATRSAPLSCSGLRLTSKHSERSMPPTMLAAGACLCEPSRVCVHPRVHPHRKARREASTNCVSRGAQKGAEDESS
jgi:hypothetical protein